jgi:hypothetical protein
MQSKGLCIDIGCANGIIGSILYCYKELKTISIDLDYYDVPLFVRAEAENLPFRDKVFDTVLACELLEHVVNMDNVVNEMIRMGDYILITVPAETYWREELISRKPDKDETLYEYQKDALIKTDPVKHHHIHHLRSLTPEDVCKLFGKVGNFGSIRWTLSGSFVVGKTIMVHENLPSWMFEVTIEK